MTLLTPPRICTDDPLKLDGCERMFKPSWLNSRKGDGIAGISGVVDRIVVITGLRDEAESGILKRRRCVIVRGRVHLASPSGISRLGMHETR